MSTLSNLREKLATEAPAKPAPVKAPVKTEAPKSKVIITEE